MKRLLFFCLIGMASLNAHAAVGDKPQPVKAFSAVIWTTTTLHSPGGKTTTFMRRTVYTRDASGNVRREIYQPTKGLQHDTTAPLERVLTGATSALELPALHSSKNVSQQNVDLGGSQFSGLPTAGRRQVFQDANGQPAHTLETWFCANLGLAVHTESRSANGNTVVTDLSELHLGDPTSSSAATVPVASPAIPLLILYRGLFTRIAHMERDRQANDPNNHVNLAEIEDHIRTKMGLSASEWHVLVDRGVRVENYTREMSKQAADFAKQDRAARSANPLAGNTLAAGRATLHKMQQDLNAHIQGEIEGLIATVGPDAAGRIQTYLQGTMASSMSVVTPAQMQARRAQKERPQ